MATIGAPVYAAGSRRLGHDGGRPGSAAVRPPGVKARAAQVVGPGREGDYAAVAHVDGRGVTCRLSGSYGQVAECAGA